MQLALDKGRAPATRSAYAEALAVIGGLSGPSKMPWWGWSISAKECITGSKLREVEGSTCSSCYALKGNYVFKNVTEAHARRLKAFDDPRFVDCFVLVLEQLHKNTRSTYILDGQETKENRFRWFDAGDLQSVKMLDAINRIALRTPQIRHWLPTREIGIVRTFLKRGGKLAENLVVRISAPMVGQSFSDLPHGLPFSTVGVEAEGIHQCVAAQQDNKCKNCSACWTKEVVNYPLH
jgi:hypothetical protein